MKASSFLKFALPLLLLVPTLATAQDVYKIDPVHSSILFKIKHLDVSWFHGRFNEVEGTVTFNEKEPTNHGVEITVNAASVDTANEKRDAHLRSPDFLNAKQFPAITFKSKEVKKAGDGNYDVTGDFTLLGVTKEITAKFEVTGMGKGMKGEQRAGGLATFSIKRSEFGMDFMPGALSDEIGLILSLQGIRE